MDTFKIFLDQINNLEHKEKVTQLLNWIHETYPILLPIIKWNQPMFTNHDTFIIGFSVAKTHIAISIEKYGMENFRLDIDEAGYEQTKMLFKIKWSQTINYDLLKRMIEYKISDKKDDSSFWKK